MSPLWSAVFVCTGLKWQSCLVEGFSGGFASGLVLASQKAANLLEFSASAPATGLALALSWRGHRRHHMPLQKWTHYVLDSESLQIIVIKMSKSIPATGPTKEICYRNKLVTDCLLTEKTISEMAGWSNFSSHLVHGKNGSVAPSHQMRFKDCMSQNLSQFTAV